MEQNSKIKFDWIDALKAFALIGIIINHFVEEFDTTAWSTNPSNDWPNFATRIHDLIPHGYSIGHIIIRYLGSIGDCSTGVFIVLSGFGLMLSTYKLDSTKFSTLEFYKKRLIRIFPLYISIHIITLLMLVFTPGNTIEIAHKYTIASLLGLRASYGLFYYINPSWWFIWLILQLYLVFPFLFRLLQKTGIKQFVIITFSFTILSRLIGILNLQHFNSLYIWMTGSFFGTRLAEFAVGMGAAYLFHQNHESLINQLTTKKIVVIGFLLCLVGIAASLTLWGSLISNLLVSTGLCGIFYGLWIAIKKLNIKLINVSVVWVGINSYAIFLFHQFPLQQTAHFHFRANRLFIALIVLVVSFPIAWLIDVFTRKALDNFQKLPNKYLVYLSMLLCITFYAVLFFIEPRLVNPVKYNLLSLFQLILVILLGLIFAKVMVNSAGLSLIYTTFILFGVYFLFMPKNMGYLCPLLFLSIYPICLAIFYFDLKRWRAALLSLLAIVIIAASAEFYLKKSRPLEPLQQWGEFKALRQDSTRVYSLIPNKTTHLKYNHYDYVLRTNRYGLASPEIDTLRPNPNTLRILLIGDAFTMPEGMKYDYSYPALLEKKIKESYPSRSIQIINGGVTGYGPVEEKAEMQELTALFKPDLIIYEFFINEFQEVGLTRKERLQDMGFIKRTSGNRNKFGNSQILAYLVKAKELLMEKIINKPGAWRYEETFLNYYEKETGPLYQTQNLNKLSNYLQSMKDIACKHHSKFFICYVPSSVCVSKPCDIRYYPWNINAQDTTEFDLQKPFKYLTNITNKLGIDVLDLTQALRRHPVQPVYFPESWHWNKEGHKAVTDEIYKYILQKKYFTY